MNSPTPQWNLDIPIDLAAPGSGPAKTPVPLQTTEKVKWEQSYDTSLRSKSDVNITPASGGFVKGDSQPKDRHGVYVLETDRGELGPTSNTQIALGSIVSKPANHLQDEVRTTMKETTHYSRMGPMMDTVTKMAPDYSYVDPTYVSSADGKKVRVSGIDNFSMKATTNYSFVPGANRGFIIQDPDNRVPNLYQKPDKNINGTSTIQRAQPDAGRFQQYRQLPKPQFSGLRETFNTESSDGSGMETRFIDAYNIQTQFNQPLNQVYNPTNKGTIPPLYTNSQPTDYSTFKMMKPPQDKPYTPGLTNINSYVLGMDQGFYNPMIEYTQSRNTRPGQIIDGVAQPGKSYSGQVNIQQMYGDRQNIIKGNKFIEPYMTLGDTTQHYVGAPR
jgi:hypothetical protein